MNIQYEPPEDQGYPLDKYTVNLTEKAQKGKLDPVVGRKEEIRRMMQILDELALQIIERKILPGSKVKVDWKINRAVLPNLINLAR